MIEPDAIQRRWARLRGHEMDWTAIIERLEPLVEAKGEPVILAKVEALRDEYS